MGAMRNAALIVAAGNSRRIGFDKLFAPVLGRPVLAWTLQAFEACPSVECIGLILNPANIDAGRELVAELGCRKEYRICLGGERRQDSVRAGLELMGGEWDYIAVHDGARMLVTPELIAAGYAAAARMAGETGRPGAVVAAVPVKDTIKVAAPDGTVIATPDRSTLWTIQTPQVFDTRLLSAAHRLSEGTDMYTDDGALVEQYGSPVRVYPGAYTNLKVTTPEDFLLAEALLRQREMGPNP